LLSSEVIERFRRYANQPAYSHRSKLTAFDPTGHRPLRALPELCNLPDRPQLVGLNGLITEDFAAHGGCAPFFEGGVLQFFGSRENIRAA
jgi:hypothetical protein